MHRLRALIVLVLLAFTVSIAQAFHFPPDAEFIVTDADGVIVAIGRAVGGTSVDVEVWSGFEGPARMTLFLPGGATRAIDVAIADGVVAVDGVDLRVLLAETFEDVAVRFTAEPGRVVDAPVGSGDADAGEPAPQGVGPDGVPPGQERRPEDPPGLDDRPEDPPGLERRPEDPPGQDRRSQDPPGADRAR